MLLNPFLRSVSLSPPPRRHHWGLEPIKIANTEYFYLNVLDREVYVTDFIFEVNFPLTPI